MKNEPKEIILHCTATRNGRAVAAEDIDRWHRARGFSKIGYHVLIQPSGKVETTLRGFEEVGAHCLGHNQDTLGIALVGGCSSTSEPEYDAFTPAQIISLIRAIRRLIELYPACRAHVTRHCAYNSGKACPCISDALYDELLHDVAFATTNSTSLLRASR